MSKKKITFTMDEIIIQNIKEFSEENCINISALSQKLWEEFLEKKNKEKEKK